jgi:quinol monooxygenase YgiN
MHARVIRVQLQPAKVGEAILLYQDSVVAAARQQQGFKGALLLTDAATNKAIAISLWQSEAQLSASESSGYLQEQLSQFESIFAAPPVIERYEVSVQV